MKNYLLSIFIIFSFNVQGDSESNKASIDKMYKNFQNGSLDSFVNHYVDLMDEDFSRWNGRYVGLGFTINQDDMTVISAERSPAIDHFKPGDKFISVNGIKAEPGVDNLPFKGAVGGVVDVTLERGGEIINVSMKRAVQTQTASKDNMVAGFTNWSEEGWSNRPKMKTINPLIAEDNEVWGSFEMLWTNAEGREISMWTVERFVFNDKGLLILHADLSEDLFVAEQNGYSLSLE